jgi:putative transposase
MNETTPSPLDNVITIDDERIKNHLDRAVGCRGGSAVQCSEARRDTRAGHYERKLRTKAGEARLRIARDRGHV